MSGELCRQYQHRIAESDPGCAHCGASLATQNLSSPPASSSGLTLGEEAAGRAVGPYRLLEPLGQWGMGVVYRAEHARTGQAAAVKMVLLPRPGLLYSIRRELYGLPRIQHPGVVRILDEGMHRGLPWYAMELVPGTSLRTYWKDVTGPPRPVTPVSASANDPPGWWTSSLSGRNWAPERPTVATSSPSEFSSEGRTAPHPERPVLSVASESRGSFGTDGFTAEGATIPSDHPETGAYTARGSFIGTSSPKMSS